MLEALQSGKPITQLLRRYNAGDHSDEDLRRLAHQRLRNERFGHTLSTTALVNQCFLRLVQMPRVPLDETADVPDVSTKTVERISGTQIVPLLDGGRTETTSRTLTSTTLRI